MHQFSVDFCADRHFDKTIIDVTVDTRRRPELDTIMRQDIAFNRAVENYIRNGDGPLHNPTFADTQRRSRVTRCVDVSLHEAVYVEAAGVMYVPDDAGLGSH